MGNLGKKEFYPRVREALEGKGYEFYDESMIKGKGSGHARKPDYVAKKGNVVVIGEIKSPSEPPTSSSWRQIQPNDSDRFKAVRTEIARLEKEGKVDKNVGGHIIIIKGQIPDYLACIGKTFEMPISITGAKVMAGYSVESSQMPYVEKAFRHCGISFERIDTGNGTTTYIFKAV